MRRSILVKSLLGSVALAASVPAHADIVTIDSSGIIAGASLSAGDNAGSFDIGDALGPTYAAPLTVNSASVEFDFVGNSGVTVGSQNFTGNTTTTPTLTNTYSNGPTFFYVYNNTSTNYYSQNNTENGGSASVTLGGANVQIGSGQSQYVGTSTLGTTSTDNGSTYYQTGNYGGYYPCGNYECSYGGTIDEYYTENYSDVTTTLIDDNGAFSVIADITDSSLLAEISNDQSLGFDINVGGDLELTAATLTVDAVPIPEPSTWILLLGGLAGTAFVRRRGRPFVGTLPSLG